MPKAIEKDARDIIMNVLVYMREEKRIKAPVLPFEKLYDRVAAATGVGERFVRKLAKEKEQADKNGISLLSPVKKKRIRTKGKIVIDDSQLEVVRRKVNEFYTVKKEIPTLKKLLNVLQEEIGFKGSRETLRKILLQTGFRFQSNRKKNTEQNNVSVSTCSVDALTANQN